MRPDSSVVRTEIPLPKRQIVCCLVERRPIRPLTGWHAFDEGIAAGSEEHGDRITVDLVRVDDPMLGRQILTVSPADDDS